MKIVLYIVIGLVALKILYEIGNAIENAARKKARERKRQREDEKSAREREAAQERLRAESEKRKEQERREEQKKEAEADKLVPRFMRSDLTKAVMKEIEGHPNAYFRIEVMEFGIELQKFVNDGTGGARHSSIRYRDLKFEPLKNGNETRAFAKTLAQSLGTEYEYKGYVYSSYGNSYYLVEYKHMDKLKPKLRSAI